MLSFRCYSGAAQIQICLQHVTPLVTGWVISEAKTERRHTHTHTVCQSFLPIIPRREEFLLMCGHCWCSPPSWSVIVCSSVICRRWLWSSNINERAWAVMAPNGSTGSLYVDLSPCYVLGDGWCNPLSLLVYVGSLWLFSFMYAIVYREMYRHMSMHFPIVVDHCWVWLIFPPVIVGYCHFYGILILPTSCWLYRWFTPWVESCWVLLFPYQCWLLWLSRTVLLLLVIVACYSPMFVGSWYTPYDCWWCLINPYFCWMMLVTC